MSSLRTLVKRIIPEYVLSRLRTWRSEYRDAQVLKMFDLSLENFNQYLDQLRSDEGFQENYQTALAQARACESRFGGDIPTPYLELIYAIIRHQQPDILVETGVGPGSTSTYILKALQDNKRGRLYSIDLPGFDSEYYPSIGKNYHVHVPEGYTPGWLVPESYRDRWDLILGDSKKELPKLLSKLGKLDFFMHDSLHTPEHTNLEFKVVWEHAAPHAVLLCDDVNTNWTFSFLDFCRLNKVEALVYGNRIGAAVRGGRANLRSRLREASATKQ